MRHPFLSVIFSFLLISFSGDVFAQVNWEAKRDSAMLAGVKTLQAKLGLSDGVTSKLYADKVLMVKGLDSLMTGKPVDPGTSGSVAARLNQQYRARVKELLTSAQWVRYQQMEQAALDSFYVRMRAKGMHVKSQVTRN